MKAIDTRRATEVSAIRRPNRSLVKLGAAGTGIAVLVVAMAYLLANAVAGPLVVEGMGEITLGNVFGFTILGGTVGAVLAYFVARFARRPRLTFLAVTLIALAGYAVVPFNAAETIDTAIWLNIFHLLVAVPVIGMVTSYLPTVRTTIEA